MQNIFQNTVQNIKNRAGRGEIKENFLLGTGAILVPKQIEIPAFNINIDTNNTQTNKTFNAPKFAKEFTNNTQSRWINLAFIIDKYQYSQALNNQFIEPIGSNVRGVFKHTSSMRDFGEISIYLSKTTIANKVDDIESLDREINFIKNILSQEKVRINHPRLGYINGAVSGSIKVDSSIVRACIITFDFKEIQADLDDELPKKSSTSKKVSFFSKIKNVIATARDYAFASVAEFNNVVSKLDKLSGTLNKSAQTINALQDNIIASLEPFNRLSHSINVFANSIKKLITFPDRLATKLEEIGKNFSNINLSLKPVKKNSIEDIKKNNTNKTIVKTLLTPTNFIKDNSDLLSSKDEISKSSYETLAIAQQSYITGLAIFVSEDINFNTVQEIDDIIKTVSNVALPLTQFQLYLGTDIYGNNIYHNIQYITNEIIDLTSEFTTIYNDFLKRLNELRNELQKTRSTIIKQPITMVNLVRLLYFGEYNPQNIDEERELINKLCFLNNIDNFHFISGKIFY
jgi:hypothetical protein